VNAGHAGVSSVFAFSFFFFFASFLPFFFGAGVGSRVETTSAAIAAAISARCLRNSLFTHFRITFRDFADERFIKFVFARTRLAEQGEHADGTVTLS